MTIVTTSCLSTAIKTACRKRKRSSQSHVRFSTQPQSIIYTYSQSDYDRSGLLPDPQPQHEKQQFIVALAFNFVPSQSSPVEQSPTFVKKSTRNKKPKLSIDTSNLHGPLYFTNMTTNHQKKSIQAISPAEDEKDDFDILTKENTRRNSLPLVL
ncbi:hypothetical protein [Parasitella parasitica]|uniref:Uncharacterized protein n=1 Tax=Parasitella parasitica TaxID=35722 RepID=A0A0B7N9N8_9FUNG|nr:hypothetical protein [Parasitella parasitica]